MRDSDLLTQLNRLDQYVRDLRESQPPSLGAYVDDKMLRRYTERMLQMAAEACIRIGVTVLTSEGLRDPANHHDIFIVLGEHAILPHELVDSMTALVELRNLIVYEHDTLEDSMVYGFLKKRLDDLDAFSRTVRQYFEKQPG